MHETDTRGEAAGPAAVLRGEGLLAFTWGTALLFAAVGGELKQALASPLMLAGIFGWLFLAILVSALAVARHADALAVRLGEPYGTLILTLSVTSIEVMSITAVMLHEDNNPHLVRDTLFSVIMITLNGMVGLALLIGGWRHREQSYDLQGANAFLGSIIPLAVLTLVLPNYTVTTVGPTLSLLQGAALAILAAGLYAVFLATQTGRHKGFFTFGDDGDGHAGHAPAPRSTLVHALFLGAYMVPVVLLAEQLAKPVDYVIANAHVPAMLGGVVIALLVATPEGIGAVRAAAANRVQRSMNILLGSVLSTIGLTVPTMLAISEITGRPLILGLEHTDMVMLLLTLAICVVTFASGRTNILQGAVHLLLFGVFVLLIFQG